MWNLGNSLVAPQMGEPFVDAGLALKCPMAKVVAADTVDLHRDPVGDRSIQMTAVTNAGTVDIMRETVTDIVEVAGAGKSL